MIFQSHKGKVSDITEANGQSGSNASEFLIADMHTHSESSHDSVCKIEDMLTAQTEKGTKIFAVTDHFDTASFMQTDIFTPIKTAHTTVKELSRTYGDRALILSGIEIGESFWYPEIYKQAMELVDHDVVIGSVHLVRYADLSYAYSKIDFSTLNKKTVVEYMDAYFDDVLTMIDTADFDILAHLTCPLRYIIGKYKIELDISRYEEKIERILKQIIEKEIALEVNTSSFGITHNFMPHTDILERYYNMGGYLITLGSDAHRREDASQYFREALQAIKGIGFKAIYYYKNRIPYKITL